MFRDTVTLFNRKNAPRGQPDTWIPTVLHDCKLDIDRAAILAKFGATAQDSALLFVPYTPENGEILVAGKPWIPPKEWDGMGDSMTFAGGDRFDFFWKGEWDGGVVSEDDSRWADEGFYSYMNRMYDYTFAITAVSKFDLIPHFEVMGK